LQRTAEAPVADPAEVMAAVDLGSNSFHMVVARARHGQLTIVDRLREMVRLASGLNDYGYLDNPSQDRALACLRRFGQRLRDMHAGQVRVVGTNTLRRARNAEAFLSSAEEALGHPVEVISGMEEARLIYLGVSHHVDGRDGPNLVVDIGGGSTELIIGEGFEPKRLESLAIGCVGLSRRFFDSGRLSRKRFDRARMAVRLELRPVAASFQRYGWAQAIGSSGTIRTAGEIAEKLGLVDRGISAAAVEDIIERMIAARRIDDVKLPGLGAERAPVFAGGVAILGEILGGFSIGHMSVSDGALREGLLYDMLGRLRHEDARELSIRAFQQRFHVDEDQADRVEATAAALFAMAAERWQINEERYGLLLTWAARLHEVGLDISHSKYHLHGGYLLANADLPGFVRMEQQLLAALVAAHRRKIDEQTLANVPARWQTALFRLIVLLRLAVLLNRSRSPVVLPPFELTVSAQQLELRFPKSWLADNPLTQADLVQEQTWLQERGFELRLGVLERAQEASAN
jgi:exopolyphosphatase/guanosine-5'-triphosphate,3'-diphosphate pyrophosphatase